MQQSSETRPANDVSTGSERGEIVAVLSWVDAASIIVGIVVGTAIFKSPTLVFQNVAGPWQALGVWTLGGVLSLIGALCYAELATTYPRSGGDYHYLTTAFGRSIGFLFGWAQLAVILTGSIASMAYAFGDYAVRLWELPETATHWLAVVSVIVLSIVNVFGILVGKRLQNLLTTIKLVGLLGIVGAGMLYGSVPTETISYDLKGPGFGLAMVFVLYAFGGWNDAAFVAAEVQDRRRNIPRALFVGIGVITLVYLLVNSAYMLVLGFDGARQTFTPATDVMLRAVGPAGGRAISLLVMASALGAVNGLILTGSRVYASLGADHSLFSWLGRWSGRRGAPAVSLVVQALIALLLIAAVGTSQGQAVIDSVVGLANLDGLPWQKYGGGFNTLVAGTAPVFWMFFLLTGFAFFRLRFRDPDRERPFRTPWYPLPPLVFCSVCAFMLYSSLDWARGLAVIGLLPLGLGVPLYAVSQRLRSR